MLSHFLHRQFLERQFEGFYIRDIGGLPTPLNSSLSEQSKNCIPVSPTKGIRLFWIVANSAGDPAKVAVSSLSSHLQSEPVAVLTIFHFYDSLSFFRRVRRPIINRISDSAQSSTSSRAFTEAQCSSLAVRISTTTLLQRLAWHSGRTRHDGDLIAADAAWLIVRRQWDINATKDELTPVLP